MFEMHKLVVSLAAGLSLLCFGTANAASTNTSFTVQVTVSTECSIAASNLIFGDPGAFTANVDSATQISITCTPSTPYTVSLSRGNQYMWESFMRRMQSAAANQIKYELYTDEARTTIWGETATAPGGAGLFGEQVSGTGNGSAQTLTVYGRIPPQTAVPAGLYQDTITATVEY